MQEAQAADDDAIPRALKTEFESLLTFRIAERRVQFIGEEAIWGLNSCSGARTSSREYRHAYGRKGGEGHRGEQKNRDWEPTYLGEDAKTELTEQFYQEQDRDGWLVRTYRLPSDEAREEYMVERVMQEVKGADSIIVVCGILHREQLAERLRRDPSNVVDVEFWEPKERRRKAGTGL